MRLHLAACAVVVAACVRVPLTVTPAELARHADELEAQGRARLPVAPDGSTVVSLDQVVEVEVERGRWLGLLRETTRRRVRLGELVARCGEGDCLLSNIREPIPVGSRLEVDWTLAKVMAGALLVTAVVGIAVVWIGEQCREPGASCMTGATAR